MTEKLLHFIWQAQYFNRSALRTTGGETITIVAPGRLNTHQGPDFQNAKIRIGNTLLAGAVELHLKTSDWNRHGHSRDENYKNVILHVVYDHDSEFFQMPIPVLELQHRLPALLLARYAALMDAAHFIPCATTIAQTRELTWLSWKERLVAERLTRKGHGVLKMLEQTGGHWEETAWRLLARSFGTKVNGDAFEELAHTLPVTVLAKHRSNLLQLEALLLGQANLLNDVAKDEYTAALQREYQFLKNKFSITPIHTPVHFLRMRPGNFPTVRLAQLAMLLHTSEHLFSTMLEAIDIADVKRWLQVTPSAYWQHHYRPGEPSVAKRKPVGSDMAESIIINTVVPLLFAYGKHHKQEAHCEKALQWLQQAKAEKNSITDGFVALGVAHKNAFDSQALLELKAEYCNHKRCLHCAVGNALLKAGV